jgi:hypothetical protein
MGAVIWAYPLMNFLQYHVCPNAVRNCLTEVGGGRSTIMAILDGSTNNPFLYTIWPNNTPNGEKKMHFFRFKAI